MEDLVAGRELPWQTREHSLKRMYKINRVMQGRKETHHSTCHSKRKVIHQTVCSPRKASMLLHNVTKLSNHVVHIRVYQNDFSTIRP